MSLSLNWLLNKYTWLQKCDANLKITVTTIFFIVEYVHGAAIKTIL